jgi:tRNA nucleotidyltransferase (CCA-adding enzyme)
MDRSTTKPPPRPPAARLAALRPIFERIRAAGGRSLCVGGFVRDLLRGESPLDLDIEVQGLSFAQLSELLAGREIVALGEGQGAKFGVIQSCEAEWALPRRESCQGPRHRDFEVTLDPELPFAEATLRRDFTVNAIAMDALSGELIDPLGGIPDLHRRVLRPVAPDRWAEDPLRALRAMQLSARLGFAASPDLLELCRGISLAELSPARIGHEWDQLMLRARRPAQGLQFLADTGLLAQFPELEALRGCPQDSTWHPEGDVWEHSLLVLDAAASLNEALPPSESDEGCPELRARLVYAALCHDLGKPLTTVEVDGAIRSPNHEPEGEAPTRSFLARLGKPAAFVETIVALVRHHLAPVLYTAAQQPAGPKAYRRLARSLAAVDSNLSELALVARADSLGRTTADALARDFPRLDRFLEKAEELDSLEAPPPDLVLGRHLIARGMKPGPAFGPILERCRQIQDEGELSDADAILDRALSEN